MASNELKTFDFQVQITFKAASLRDAYGQLDAILGPVEGVSWESLGAFDEDYNPIGDDALQAAMTAWYAGKDQR